MKTKGLLPICSLVGGVLIGMVIGTGIPDPQNTAANTESASSIVYVREIPTQAAIETVSAPVTTAICTEAAPETKTVKETETVQKTKAVTEAESAEAPAAAHETVYITPTGKKYHYSEKCAGKNASPTPLSEAKKSKDPCKKCVK